MLLLSPLEGIEKIKTEKKQKTKAKTKTKNDNYSLNNHASVYKLNRPFAAKPSRDIFFLKLWAIT